MLVYVVLNTVVRDGLTEKVAFEERREGDNRVIKADVWGRAFQAEGTASAKLRGGNVLCTLEGEQREQCG